MAYDKEAEYAKKSMAELITIRNRFELALILIDRPQAPKMINEQLQWVKMKIAERIGKK